MRPTTSGTRAIGPLHTPLALRRHVGRNDSDQKPLNQPHSRDKLSREWRLAPSVAVFFFENEKLFYCFVFPLLGKSLLPWSGRRSHFGWEKDPIIIGKMAPTGARVQDEGIKISTRVCFSQCPKSGSSDLLYGYRVLIEDMGVLDHLNTRGIDVGIIAVTQAISQKVTEAL